MIGPAPAKINLAHVVGPLRADGKHNVATVLQRVDLCDRIAVEPAVATTVEGFSEDTIVRKALDALDAPHGWRVRLRKRIPVAAGVGGGSTDAATALRLANAQLAEPLALERLHELATTIGADVPFFLRDGPQLGMGDGSELAPVELPQDFFVVLLLPHGVIKQSTAKAYADFDARGGEDGWERRLGELRAALAVLRRPRDLAALPLNDLGPSPHAHALAANGAFRADISGAGPMVYGLFHRRADARRAARAVKQIGRVWITVPAWYG